VIKSEIELALPFIVPIENQMWDERMDLMILTKEIQTIILCYREAKNIYSKGKMTK
jgi:hypothetical protein